MLWGCIALLLISILLIFIIVNIIIILYKRYVKDNKKNTLETFLNINDSNLYMPSTDKELPAEIQYQIPAAGNDLTDIQSEGIDTDVLRNVRFLTNFSQTDELDFYQMYNILKKMKNNKYTIKYDPSLINRKSQIIPSEKLIELNSGAINNTDLELFTTLKLDLISALNNIIIANGYYVPYHPYQFFKIINSNMISQSGSNYVFTLTIAREYKFQQFVIYYDLDLVLTDSSKPSEYSVNLNKLELIGIPIPNTVEFHENRKTELKSEVSSIVSNSFKNTDNDMNDSYYKDQVSDSATFDVMPIGDKSKVFQSPYMKFIDLNERSDMDPTLLDQNSASTKVEDRIMNVARDQQFTNNRCFGLVNGVSQELPQYKNPIFCTSFHPEISQNGIWDAPCQVNSDCPFYRANKNYPNEFGKCDKETGQCEMPLGVIPIGYTKYGRIEPDCYNCESVDINYLIKDNYGSGDNNDKCCKKQNELIKSGKVNYKSPDYVFKDDEPYRRQFGDELLSVGLNVNPSI